MVDASQVFIPAAAPGNGVKQVFALPADLGPCTVRRILITWPAGCGGLLFIQIQAAGGFAFPNQPGMFLAFDDYTYVIDVSNQTNSGKWSIVYYNLDYIDHDPIIVFEFDYLRGDTPVGSTTPIAI
jgi:hypothetical protein